jgi:imidazolonepropionase-like amidohydrolase
MSTSAEAVPRPPLATTAARRATLAAAIALSVLAHAAPLSVVGAPFEPDSGSLAVHCGALFDGSGAAAARDITVLVRAGHIESLTPGSAHPSGVRSLELGDYTCLPGLIDMHTHLTDEPGSAADLSVVFRRSDAEWRRIGARNARATLRAGFTTVRDVGTYVAWNDRALRDAINAGRVVGPRMQVVGYYLTIRGGGGDLLIPGYAEKDIPARVRQGVARGPQQFALKAQQAIDGGADLLKVIASGAVLAYGGVPGAPEMTQEEIAAVVKVAHAAGRKVAAHAHGAQSIKDAILAGADTIEHASYIDAEDIALAKEHGVALSMDVYNGDYIDTVGRAQHWPEEFLRKNVETTEVQRQGFTAAHAAGVTMVFGTDAAVYPHGLNARQFPIMVARGMTPMEAIQTATVNAARVMGWGDRVGRLAPGLFGDLIAVRGDPLKDIGVLQHVAVVIKGGVPFRLPAAPAPARAQSRRVSGGDVAKGGP